MTDREKLRNRLKMTGVQTATGLIMLVFGIIGILEDYLRIVLKKDGADTYWVGVAMLIVGCLLIGVAANTIATAIRNISDRE